MSTVLALVLALAFPAPGLSRGLDAITQCAIRGKTPLERACKAQPLAVVIRDPLAHNEQTHADEAKPTIVVSKWTPHPDEGLNGSSNTSIHAAQPSGVMLDVYEPGDQMKVVGDAGFLPVSASSTQNSEEIKEIGLCKTKVRDKSSAKYTGRNDQGTLLERPSKTTAIAPKDLRQGTHKAPQDLEKQLTTGASPSIMDHKTETTTRTDPQNVTAKIVQENLRAYSQDPPPRYEPESEIHRWHFYESIIFTIDDCHFGRNPNQPPAFPCRIVCG